MANNRNQSSGFVARMLKGHAAVGLAVGALLYILCLSGTVMVFHEELERWEQPNAPEMAAIDPGNAAKAGVAGLARADEPPHHFYLGLPTTGMPRVTVSLDQDVAWFAHPDGTLAGEIHHPFTDFIQELHYYLHLPKTLGLTVVGILGVMLAKLVLSGLLAHPRIFRDAFALRLKGNPQLREADIHNRLSVWGMPFHFLVALTGAVLGLASVLSFVVSSLYLDSDIEAFYEPLFGAEPIPNEAPAPVYDIAAALKNLRATEPGLEPWYVIMEDPGTKGQAGYVLAKHPARLIYGENYYFDADGTITGKLGHSDGPVSQQIIASAYTVHFGSFGGLPVKLVYGVLGLALSVVCATGINIWLVKRREKGRPAPRLERAWAGAVWGTPLAFSFALLLALAGVAVATINAAFWIGLLAIVGVSLRVDRPSKAAGLWRLFTGVLLLAGLAGYGLLHQGAIESPAAVGVSVALLGIASLFVWSGLRTRKGRQIAAAE